MSCRTEVQISLKDPSKTSVTGAVTGRDISLNLDRMALPVNDCHMMLNFAEKDISMDDRLLISENVHVVLDYHKKEDQLREESLGKSKLESPA